MKLRDELEATWYSKSVKRQQDERAPRELSSHLLIGKGAGDIKRSAS